MAVDQSTTVQEWFVMLSNQNVSRGCLIVEPWKGSVVWLAQGG